MTSRSDAAESTRARIAQAAFELFAQEYYDDVTLRRIAAAAGVALQTVVNHFGTKDGLLAVAVERWSEEISARRDGVPPGDVPAAVAALVGDYELTGAPTLRALAVEDRVAVLRPVLETGRARHRAWVERVLAPGLAALPPGERRRRTAQLATVTDVYAWKLLRHDHGLSRAETVRAMTEVVTAVIPTPTTPEDPS